MPPTSWLAPSVASESVSASLISFVLIFAIALRVRRDFSTVVSSLPYNVLGGTPQFVKTSYTAGKVFFTVATDEDLRKTWLGGAGFFFECSRTLFHRAANFVASLSTRSHSQGGQELIIGRCLSECRLFLWSPVHRNCKPVRRLETKAESTNLESVIFSHLS